MGWPGWRATSSARLVPEPELRDAQAIAAGGRPLSELTTAEKVRRIAEAKERGITGPDALYTPAAGEPGGSSERPLTANDVAKFASKSLEEKVRLGAEGAERGLSPAEVVRNMRDTFPDTLVVDHVT
jgi:hypothetical protein